MAIKNLLGVAMVATALGMPMKDVAAANKVVSTSKTISGDSQEKAIELFFKVAKNEAFKMFADNMENEKLPIVKRMAAASVLFNSAGGNTKDMLFDPKDPKAKEISLFLDVFKKGVTLQAQMKICEGKELDDKSIEMLKNTQEQLTEVMKVFKNETGRDFIQVVEEGMKANAKTADPYGILGNSEVQQAIIAGVLDATKLSVEQSKIPAGEKKEALKELDERHKANGTVPNPKFDNVPK